MEFKFNSTIQDVKKDMEDLKALFAKFNTMSDEVAEDVNEEFYGFLEQAGEIGADQYGFDFDEVWSYYKVRLWLEMARKNG